MKNNRIALHKWQTDGTEQNVDIPWPEIHQVTGYDEITWLQNQDTNAAQLILEKSPDGEQSLWAEFYNDKVHLEYMLRFAK